ncbi:hypothetical protein H0H93_001162 [Arthromyces matolae]|nr:hypothetical protein H0H93_001162 [Arthromyces matolae]
MWNNQPPPPSFPQPGYSPSYYPPPQGPPPSGYAPPSGPPPHVQSSNYPGQRYHETYTPQYAPPTGPPPPPPTTQQHYGPQFQGSNEESIMCKLAVFSHLLYLIRNEIGINYFGQNPGQLKGCINDVHNMVNFLTSHFNYRREDIVILTDDQQNPRSRPTRDNIIEAMQWLVRGAAPNDSLFFHYSGHGGQTKDLDGDEEDGNDEVIYPVDFKQNGHIVDDLLFEIMSTLPISSLPASLTLPSHATLARFWTFPTLYGSHEGKIKEPNLAAEAGQGLLSAVSSYARGDMSGVLRSAMGLVKIVSGNQTKSNEYARKTRTSPADAISWSGCKDSQTSADTQEQGQATGAMSYAFIAALRNAHAGNNTQQSYQQLLVNIREILRAKYSQKPQLSSSHPMRRAARPSKFGYAFVCTSIASLFGKTKNEKFGRILTPSTKFTNVALNTSRRSASAARSTRHTSMTPPPPPPVKHGYNYGGTEPRKNEVMSRKNNQGISESALDDRSMSVRTMQIARDAGEELERQVRALEAIANAQEAALLEPPNYSEEELMSFYEDLLANPSAADISTENNRQDFEQRQIDEDMAVVCAAEERAIDEPLASSSTQAPMQPYQRLLSYARHTVSRIEVARETVKRSPNVEPSIARDEFLPIAILSEPEFRSILRLAIVAGDADGANTTLDLMKRSGISIPEDMITSLLKVYAQAGNVSGVEQVLVNYLHGPPTSQQRHFHVKSHLVSNPTESIPNSALKLLHSYEAQALPAPIQTYTSVITTLFASNSSLGRAHAWDLFSHMRYVAHANPDAALYTLMIRACASPINMRPSEPERALDLWHEMTVDHRIQPTSGAYDAVILACARSGKATYVNEAFRLAKQMLDSHRDATGKSAHEPSRRTYCALLEGAKRIGDLPRARWILAQMIASPSNAKEDAVNEEVMMHIFHAYASYRPPFNRSLVKKAESNDSIEESSVAIDASPQKPSQDSTITTTQKDSFSHIPPQSSTEVIHEVQILFDRILHDSGMKLSADPTDGGALPAAQRFAHVVLSPRLLNSYLAVHYKHASFEDACEQYNTIFAECGVSRTGRTYVEALERCAIARRGHERTVVSDFAEKVWVDWSKLEDTAHENRRPLSGRIIERAYIAMIRTLSLTNDVDRAMERLRAFAARYPPSEVRPSTPKPAMRSTRTVLTADRPLVRLTSAIEVPDDHVPPLIMFDDLEVLHHRLVARRSFADIKYITWLSKAFEGALRARRNAALKVQSGLDGTQSTACVAASSN